MASKSQTDPLVNFTARELEEFVGSLEGLELGEDGVVGIGGTNVGVGSTVVDALTSLIPRISDITCSLRFLARKVDGCGHWWSTLPDAWLAESYIFI